MLLIGIVYFDLPSKHTFRSTLFQRYGSRDSRHASNKIIKISKSIYLFIFRIFFVVFLRILFEPCGRTTDGKVKNRRLLLLYFFQYSSFAIFMHSYSGMKNFIQYLKFFFFFRIVQFCVVNLAVCRMSVCVAHFVAHIYELRYAS